MRYCGEYHDAETGFIYLRARYYDPTIGRFASEDPHWNLDNMIYGDPEESETLDVAPKVPSYIAIAQSTNLYPYCANNPVSFVDSDGESIIVIAAALTVAVGGLLLGGCADPNAKIEVSSNGKVYSPNEFGYYGTKGNSGDSSIRHMPGGQSAAWDFFSAMTTSINLTDNGYIGYDEYGTIYYYRSTSKDGTAVVSINGKDSGAKSQKIHFEN